MSLGEYFRDTIMARVSRTELWDYKTELLNEIRDADKNLKFFISSHFDKFVECRKIISCLNRSIDGAVSSTGLAELEIFRAPSKIKHLTEMSQFFSKMSDLTDIHTKLGTAGDNFIPRLKEGFRTFRKYRKSKYVQLLWEQAKDIRQKYVDTIIKSIEECPFTDPTLEIYFNEYFEYRKVLFADEGSSSRVYNTLLIKYKLSNSDLFTGLPVLAAVDKSCYLLLQLIKCKLPLETSTSVINSFYHTLNESLLSCVACDLEIIIGVINLYLEYVLRMLRGIGQLELVYMFDNGKNELIFNIMLYDFDFKIESRLASIISTFDDLTHRRLVCAKLAAITADTNTTESFPLERTVTSYIDKFFPEDTKIQEYLRHFQERLLEENQNIVRSICDGFNTLRKHVSDDMHVVNVLEKVIATIKEYPQIYESILRCIVEDEPNATCAYIINNIIHDKYDTPGAAVDKNFVDKFEQNYKFFYKKFNV